MHRILTNLCPGSTSVATILVGLTLSILLCDMVLFIVRRLLGRGSRIPLGRGNYFRRWVEPTDPDTCSYIVGVMKGLCQESVGCLLPHPALHGNIEALHNKTVLIAYNKHDKPSMFNMMLRPTSPPGMENCIINHLGLVIVANEAKGKGLQQLCALNFILQSISFRSLKIYITDVGDSPSAFRLMSRYITGPFPDYRNPEKAPPENYVKIFNHVMDNYRKDIGISDNAQPNPENFVIKYSNEPTGGGSAALAAFSQERQSRDQAVNAFFYDRVKAEDYDELFTIGISDWPAIKGMIASTVFGKKKL